MAGINSKALNEMAENRYKFNDGSELGNKEFGDGVGLDWYETPNRSYDTQIGRFWQVDEYAEIAEEWSPFTFAYDNPISFNDPLGLFGEEPGGVENNGVAKVLPEATVFSLPKGFWAKQRFYYSVRDLLHKNGASNDDIRQPNLREFMHRFDGITRHRESVSEQTRSGDRIALEIGSLFIPIPASWLLKVKRLKYVTKIFNFKKGKAATNIAEEGVEQVFGHGDEVTNVAKTPVGRSGNILNVVTKNSPTTINGTKFTGHALDQMQARGILSPSVVLDVIKNPARILPGNTPGTTAFLGNNLKVITNKAGDIITVIPQ